MSRDIVVAFDTANEVIAVGVGRIVASEARIEVLASHEEAAFRASNTRLVNALDEVLAELGIGRSDIACVVCGRGPGSFTGVRICMATAKGVAIGLDVPLFGVSTSDAQGWEAWHQGVRGSLVVVGDAMRKEVYPVRMELSDSGVERFGGDAVIKAATLPEWLGDGQMEFAGDALAKYGDLLEGRGAFTEVRHPTGRGLLLAAWNAPWFEAFRNACNPELTDESLEAARDAAGSAFGNPCALLPVYTRLSDAEEHERARFAAGDAVPARDLQTGVQGSSSDAPQIRYQPLDAAWVADVARMESEVMGSDAWNEAQILDELPRPDRTWWAAYQVANADERTVTPGSGELVGYAGGMVVDGTLTILKVASSPALRQQGIARALLGKLAEDARDLGATEATLEVRLSNTGAHAFYEKLGFERIGVRPRYYSDREDAVIYTGPLPVAVHDVAGMDLRVDEAGEPERIEVQGGLILAIESSCDETAAAIVDEAGTIVCDVVASQIDFHSRFGGVVPEIASRKHIEAIGGVALECLERARIHTGNPALDWSDLAAVSVTYAPGLVGALVVGVAFAKGLAWAADKPLIGVNHLEGHIYANKIEHADIQPPMVVSLVSGGHTMLVHVRDWGDYETLGSTLDDAVGEAFDKVAKALGLGYPGGPIISRLAAEGDPKAIDFPRALLRSGDLQFSLSGLKTSVVTYLDKQKRAGNPINANDVAASFQQAVIDVQVAKARTALEQTGAREFCLGGGVAANPALREAYEQMCAQMGVRLTLPPLSACTDNAAMIALVALDRYHAGKFFDYTLDVSARAPLDEPY